MTNGERPLSEIQAFVAKAKNVGVYNGSQAANLSQSLRLAVEHAKAHGVDTDALTVEQAGASVGEWLDEYGGENKATVQSIATYKGRAKKLIDDFTKWNGGDFMAWKKTLVKAPKAARKPKAKEVETPTPPLGNGGDEHQPGEKVHLLRLPGGNTGKLILPDPITQKEINAAWAVLGAYKTLLEAQAKIDEAADDDTDGGETSE